MLPAIDRQRNALLRMIAALLVLAGGGVVSVLPRGVRERILRVLRPAEAALRRLVVIVRADMDFVPRVAGGRCVGLRIPRGAGAAVPVFALFDPRKQVGPPRPHHPAGFGPRIWEPGMDYPVFETKAAAKPDDLIDARRLCQRMLAVQNALGDLPKQARRLARMEAKREAARAETGKYIRAMRPGRPPGHRARWAHPIDDVLRH